MVTFKNTTITQTGRNGKEDQTEKSLGDQIVIPDSMPVENVQMIKLISQLINNHQKEIKAEVAKTDKKISDLEVNKNTVSEQLNSISTAQTEQLTVNSNLKTEISDLREQVRVLTNTVVRNYAIIKEGRDVKEVEDIHKMRNEMVFRGIEEKQKENCITVIKEFMSQKMKIGTEAVKIVKAHRMGSGKDRPMLIELASTMDKGKIYKHVKNLKGLTNMNDQYYQVSDHLPAKTSEAQLHYKRLKKINSKKTVDQLEMSLTRGELQIQGQRYNKLVQTPSEKQILLASKEEKARWKKVKVKEGNVVKKEGCEFHGYSLVANKVDTVRDAYCKLKEMHGGARHIVMAMRFPGRNWHILQDYQDDDEHGAGRQLLSMLQKAEIFNRAVFVVRYYGGKHLGPSRFNAFVEAAQSAITHDPYNHFNKENQTPWPKESDPKKASGQNEQRGTNGNCLLAL